MTGDAKPLRPITPIQRDAMRVIQEWVDREGMAPTLAELANELGGPSRGWAHGIVSRLVDAGYLHRPAGASWRNLTILARVPIPSDLDDLVNAEWSFGPELRPAAAMGA